MNRALSYLFLGLVIVGPLTIQCQAQEAPDKPQSASSASTPLSGKRAGLLKQYRFYVGAHAAAQVFQLYISPLSGQEAILTPVHLFAGYQLTPHLAVQAGFMQRTSKDYRITSTSVNQNNQTVVHVSRVKQYDAAIPATLRFRLARRPSHRLYLDALLGSTLLFHRYEDERISTIGGQVQNNRQFNTPLEYLYLSAGLSAGCRLTPKFDLMAEATTIRNLKRERFPSTIFTYGVGVGVRYSFDLSRKASKS
jgi:hypothetical protein